MEPRGRRACSRRSRSRAARRLREDPPWLIVLKLCGWLAVLTVSFRAVHLVWSFFLA